jgi:hypothetical protein
MNAKSCPISFELIDANIVRINSFYVGLIFMLFLLTQNSAVIIFLVFDFTTRIFINRNYSLLLILSRKTKQLLSIEPRMEDIAPKRLASYFGLIFTVVISISSLFGFSIALYSLSVILAICIVLEVVFSYCLGCEVYHLYKRFV